MSESTKITMIVSSIPTRVPLNHIPGSRYSLGKGANDSYDLYDNVINICDRWSPDTLLLPVTTSLLIQWENRCPCNAHNAMDSQQI